VRVYYDGSLVGPLFKKGHFRASSGSPCLWSGSGLDFLPGSLRAPPLRWERKGRRPVDRRPSLIGAPRMVL